MDALNGETLDLLQRLGVALAIGLMVGLERGWHERDLPEGRRIAGVRTFGIIGLLGGAAALLSHQFGQWVVAALALALGALTTVAHWRAAPERGDLGITTLCVVLLVFALGALAGTGQFAVSAIAAVVVTILLGTKAELHASLRHIEREELFATMRLLLITVVVLPILPDKGYGPWEALNPYRIWLMVVLIAGISYVGYFAVRLIGARRGLLVTGLLGGLASSTAVAVGFARAARRSEESRDILAAGVIAASSMMFPRMLVVLAVVAPPLAVALSGPLLAAGLTGFAFSAWFARRGTAEAAEETRPGTRNPLELRAAIQFGLLLTAIILATRAVTAWVGEAGLYMLAALSGIADVDAILLSLASMWGGGGIAFATAATGILIAAAVNSMVKPILAAAIGGGSFGARVGAGLGFAIAAGGIVLWLTGGRGP